MCELAILNPSKYSVEDLTEIAMGIYESQRDSLGIVGIVEIDGRTSFEYPTFKDTNPDEDDVYEFVDDFADWSTRLIIHGRLATQGEVTEENAHPLEIECDKCNVDYVLHNGVCYNYKREKPWLADDGHNFQTDVDSEIIAHNWGDVPSDFDHETLHNAGQSAYILLNEERAFIFTNGRYNLHETGTMALNYRNFGPQNGNNSYQQVILTPKNAE
jgi:glutamine phosphoribosylpyrophosphate amidotransferase